MQRGTDRRSWARWGATIGALHLFGFPFALLFLAVVLAWTHGPITHDEPGFRAMDLGWVRATQIGGTAAMLMTHGATPPSLSQSAYLKTEPVLGGPDGAGVPGRSADAAMGMAIIMAMAGVALISVNPQALTGGVRPALLGLSIRGAVRRLRPLAIAGAILSLHCGQFRPGLHLFAWPWGLTLQTLLLLTWLVLFNRAYIGWGWCGCGGPADGGLRRPFGQRRNSGSWLSAGYGSQRAHPGAGEIVFAQASQPALSSSRRPRSAKRWASWLLLAGAAGLIVWVSRRVKPKRWPRRELRRHRRSSKASVSAPALEGIGPGSSDTGLTPQPNR